MAFLRIPPAELSGPDTESKGNTLEKGNPPIGPWVLGLPGLHWSEGDHSVSYWCSKAVSFSANMDLDWFKW